MLKKLLPLFISAGLLFAGVASAIVTLPPSIQKGDLLVATSTTQLVRFPTSTLGSVLTMFNNLPTWRATSTLGFTGGGTPCVSVAGSIQYNNGGAFGCVPVGSAGTALFASSTSASGYEWKGVAGAGTVTSVDMTVPTGLTVSGNPISAAGTLTVTLTAGYNIPLTASTTNWNTAYGWGNHATAGYLTASALVPYLTTTTAASTYQPIGSYLTGTKVDSFNTRTGAVTLTSGDVTTALTFTPYNATNPNNYIALTALSGTAPINYNNGTGVISLTGIVPIANGGTGTSTAPTLGQLLMGNASGGYNLVATSTLGITGGGAYNVISANGLITVSTTTALATLTASTSPNFTAVSATNASTTNLTVATNIYLPGVTNCNSSQYLQITSGIFGCGTPAGGGGSLSGGTTGYVATWASSTALTTGLLLDNGTVAGVNATSTGTTFFVKGGVGDNPFVVASSTGTALITVLPSGYVGIGYNNPQAPLEVKNSTSGIFKILRLQTSGNAGNTGVLSFANTVAGGPTTGVDVSSIGNYVSNGTYATFATDMLFNTSYNGAFNVQKMILTGEGRLGIGTSSPVGMLAVQGTTTTANLPIFVVASSTNAQLFVVGANGAVGIGTTTSPFKLSVQGTANVNPFNVSSSTGASLFSVSLNGRVGIGSSSPSSLFTVDSTGTNATTTIQFDSIGTKGTCLVLKDADGTGNTYCSVNNGTITCSTGACN